LTAVSLFSLIKPADYTNDLLWQIAMPEDFSFKKFAYTAWVQCR